MEILVATRHRLRPSAARALGGAPLSGRKQPRARVLVVDDDAIDRMLARAKLDVLGCEAVVVGSGQAALDSLSAEPFDLVFMDCRMPNLDGYETTRRLRRGEDRGELAHLGRLPVIAATAGPDFRELCEAAGMNDVLVKPYSREEIKVILERWLRDPSEEIEGVGRIRQVDRGPSDRRNICHSR